VVAVVGEEVVAVVVEEVVAIDEVIVTIDVGGVIDVERQECRANRTV
jgi:hypothetical protein